MAYQDHRRQSQNTWARCAIITVSDTRTAETDVSGKQIADLLIKDGHLVIAYKHIPDDVAALHGTLNSALTQQDVDVILTNGGTGISRRDTTIQAVEEFLDQTLPGFGELFRMLSWEQIGSGAMLSRAVGGIARGKLLFALPGSTAAVELAMTKLILPEMRHLLHELRK